MHSEALEKPLAQEQELDRIGAKALQAKGLFSQPMPSPSCSPGMQPLDLEELLGLSLTPFQAVVVSPDWLKPWHPAGAP